MTSPEVVLGEIVIYAPPISVDVYGEEVENHHIVQGGLLIPAIGFETGRG